VDARNTANKSLDDIVLIPSSRIRFETARAPAVCTGAFLALPQSVELRQEQQEH
jgi:hypothetical protein